MTGTSSATGGGTSCGGGTSSLDPDPRATDPGEIRAYRIMHWKTHCDEGAIVRVQAEVSIYPLREQHLSESIAQFHNAMDRPGLAAKTGAMSTEIAGDSGDVFRGLCDAFEQLAKEHDVVFVCKVSNACAPSASRGEEDEILGAIQKMRGGNAGAAELDTPQALSAESRSLIALAAAIAHQREARVIEACVQQSLACGATPESVMQVVCQATQMAELPARSYELAAHRGIETFGARDIEPPRRS